MRIRFHKIWSMRIRIQDKNTKFISNNLLKVKKKKIFSNLYLNLRHKLLFFRKIEFPTKKTPKHLLVKLCFSLNFNLKSLYNHNDTNKKKYKKSTNPFFNSPFMAWRKRKSRIRWEKYKKKGKSKKVNKWGNIVQTN